MTYDEEFLRQWEESKRQLRGRIYRIVRNHENTEDLLQDVFCRVYQRARTLDPGTIPKYCMTAARNASIEELKRNKRLEYREVYVVCEKTPHEEYLNRLRECALHDALDQLPTRQREVVDAYLEGGNVKERASQMGVPYSTFRHRRQRALESLRRSMKNYKT